MTIDNGACGCRRCEGASGTPPDPTFCWVVIENDQLSFCLYEHPQYGVLLADGARECRYYRGLWKILPHNDRRRASARVGDMALADYPEVKELDLDKGRLSYIYLYAYIHQHYTLDRKVALVRRQRLLLSEQAQRMVRALTIQEQKTKDSWALAQELHALHEQYWEAAGEHRDVREDGQVLSRVLDTIRSRLFHEGLPLCPDMISVDERAREEMERKEG